MSAKIPAEILDAITFYVEASNNLTDQRNDYNSRRFKTQSKNGRKALCDLRLVDRAFCHSASPRLFRYIDATYCGKNGLARLLTLRHIARSAYASHVRHIDIGIDCERLSPECRIYAEQLAQLISPCLLKFQQLGSLDFIYRTKNSISHSTKDLMTTALAEALHAISLPSLVELDLSFPLAYDFCHFFKSESPISIYTILGRLRHLGVHVQEYTSLVDYRDRRQRIEPQNAALPNEKYANHLLNLARHAENVDSLAISSTNIINLDMFPFIHLGRLKSICFRGTSLKGSTLVNLIHQSPDMINSIRLLQVELHSEMWEEILQELSKLPNLIDIHLESCTYSTNGTNSGFRPTFWPVTTEVYEIESLSLDDISALVDLLQQVNVNRKFAGLFPMRLDRDKYTRAENLLFGMDDMEPEEQMYFAWGRTA